MNFPLDKIQLLIDWLRGKGAPDRNTLIHTVLDILKWAADMMFPAPGAATTAFKIPDWLLQLLMSLLQRFLLPGMAVASSDDDVVNADKMEQFCNENKAA